MKERITYLDTAKGILILLMLIGHIWNNGLVHDFIYVFHMPAFFIISGMLCKKTATSLQSFGSFLTSRLFSLIIPYLCFEVYGILIDIICHGAYLNYKGYAYQIITLNLFNGPLWFLMVLFLSSLLFYFFRSIPQKYLLTIAIPLLIVFSLIIPQYPNYISPSTVNLALLYMTFGFLLKDKQWELSSGRGQLLLWFCLTFLFTFCNIGEMPDYQSGYRVLFLLGSFVGTIFILKLSKHCDHRVLQFWGQNSLIVLGSHYPIIRLTKHFLLFEEFSVYGGVLFFLLIIPIEFLIIKFVNRYLPFVAGKREANHEKNHAGLWHKTGSNQNVPPC